ncbi:MAG: hypothetical protein AB1305_01935 [Candidatus Hadarchaeota archaeon]
MEQLTWLGIAFILIGAALVALPIIGRNFDFSRVPSWLIYIYRSDGFYFVTSPLLLALSLLSVVIFILRR